MSASQCSHDTMQHTTDDQEVSSSAVTSNLDLISECIACAIVRSIRSRFRRDEGIVRLFIEADVDTGACRTVVQDDCAALPEDHTVRSICTNAGKPPQPPKQALAAMLSPPLTSAEVLSKLHLKTTGEDESVVRQYTLDNSTPLRPLPPATKSFEDGCALCYTEVFLHWQPYVTLHMLTHSTDAALQHLCMLALPVHLELHVPNTPGPPLVRHIQPTTAAKAAAEAFPVPLPHSEQQGDTLAVAGHADNNDGRPTYDGAYAKSNTRNTNKHSRRWTAHAMLVLHPFYEDDDNDHVQHDTPSSDDDEVVPPTDHHSVPVYLFRDYAPLVHPPALEGVQRAEWDMAGLHAGTMMLPDQPASHVGTPQAMLPLLPPARASNIAALVVHVEPCQHAARSQPPLSATVERRMVRQAVEGALAGAKKAHSSAFVCKAEERVALALPRIAKAVASILSRQANMDAGRVVADRDDMADDLLRKLHALSMQDLERLWAGL